MDIRIFASSPRRQALDEAASVLEPTFDFSFVETGPEVPRESTVQPEANEVTSQVTSQLSDLDDRLRDILEEVGSSGWTRSFSPRGERRAAE